MLEKFDEFINNYDMEDERINQKYHHSLNVYNLAKTISKQLKFSDLDQEIATVIGLLHDYGRFDQLKFHDSFNDANLDHADYSVKLLFEDNKIKDFYQKEENYQVISFAIKNHNKYNIEPTTNQESLKHAKLIRDLDKLDILRWFERTYFNKQTNDKVSKSVIEQIKNKQTINKSNIKNPNDGLVVLLAFIYDVNYQELMPLFIIEYNKIFKKLNHQFDEVKEILKENLNGN